VGSRDELKELSGVYPEDLHKHFVDKITIPCKQCGKTMYRVPEVLDCWFESGSMPYAQVHYPFENKKYFEELITTGKIKEIRPSDVWYREREDFSENAIGTDMKKYTNIGFELLRGKPVFNGEILGGCLESIYDMFDNSRYEDTVYICNKYNLFPKLKDWQNKILLLETSEEKPEPDLFRKMIRAIKEQGIFDVLSGVLVGKPQNEIYYYDYRKILLEEISNEDLSIVYNLNVGHATPRCIIPFGVNAEVNVDKQVIIFNY